MESKRLLTYLLSLISTFGISSCSDVKVTALEQNVYAIVGMDITLKYNVETELTAEYVQIQIKKSNSPGLVQIAKLTIESNNIAMNEQFDNRIALSFNYPLVSFKLKSLKEEELDAVFKCNFKAKETVFAEGSATILVEKADAPIIFDGSIFKDDNGTNVKVNGSRDFVCRAEGKPEPTLKWIEMIKTEGNVLKAGRSPLILKLEKVKKSDSGPYLCVAENIGGNATKTMILIVTFIKYKNGNSPYITDTISGNEKLSYKCPIAGYPVPKYSWWHHGTSGAVSIDGKDSNQIFLHKVHDKDLGNYTCTATNEAGKLTWTVDVKKSITALRTVDSSGIATATPFFLIILHVLLNVFLIQ